MWLEQKVFLFQTEKEAVGKNIVLDNIFLKVNENLTTVNIKDLFLKISPSSIFDSNIEEVKFDKETKTFELKGWSILEKVIPITKIFKAHEEEQEKDLEISFYSEELGNIIISDISNPLSQWNNKKFEEEDLKQFEKDIIQLSLPKKEKEVEGEGKVLPDSDPSLLINKRYESGKARYIQNGYKEYAYQNFRLLLKKNIEKTIAILVEILNENEVLQFSSPEKSDLENFYSFKDEERNRKLNAKIIDDKLEVEVINN